MVVPPRSIETEKIILGSILAKPQIFYAVAEVIGAEHFYSEANRWVWKAMEQLAEARKPIDPEHLHAALEAHGDEVGAGYIGDLAGAIGNEDWACQHAEIIRNLALRRRLAEFAAQLQSRACEGPETYSPDYAIELLGGAQYDLEQIASLQERPQECDWRQIMDEQLWKIANHKYDAGIPTGFPAIDRVFGGFPAGEDTVLGARTSLGKTQLALNFAINAASGCTVDSNGERNEPIGEVRTWPTAVFNLEMPIESICLRPVGPLAQVNFFRAAREGYQLGEEQRVEQAAAWLKKLPLKIFYRTSFSPRALAAECRRLVREMGLEFFILDYQGLMRGDRREKERWQEQREVVLRIRDIAAELKLAALVLSQLNREVDGRHEPSLSHLRDTGAAEEHPSNVLMLWQSGEDAHPDCWQEIRLEIKKQRNGPVNVHIDMEFLKSTGEFRCGPKRK